MATNNTMGKTVKALTINDLAKLCKEQIKKGNGNKKIVISSDDEGNEYHELFFGFTPTQEEGNPLNYFETACVNLPYGVSQKEIKDYIILG